MRTYLVLHEVDGVEEGVYPRAADCAQYPVPPLPELLLLLLPLLAELTGLVITVPDGEIMYHCPPYPCPL
jgi:hypothetical protein